MPTLEELLDGIIFEYGCEEKEGGGFNPIVIINGKKQVSKKVFDTEKEAIDSAKSMLFDSVLEALAIALNRG